MRSRLNSCVIVTAMLLVLPSPAAAQRVPAAESGAIGGELGMFIPVQDGMGTGLALEGFYEYYLTARGSIRMGLGWAEPDFSGEGDDSLRHIRVALDGVYNWEGGNIHPFVGAGVGIYFLQLESGGESVGDSETKLGATFFGGVELFTSNTVSVKGEVRYHLISDMNGLNPDGVSLSIGLKKYF